MGAEHRGFRGAQWSRGSGSATGWAPLPAPTPPHPPGSLCSHPSPGQVLLAWQLPPCPLLGQSAGSSPSWVKPRLKIKTLLFLVTTHLTFLSVLGGEEGIMVFLHLGLLQGVREIQTRS